MSSLGTPKGNGQAYWRSLEELSDTPEFRSFMHREFPSGASELLDGTDRRHFQIYQVVRAEGMIYLL